MIDNKALRSISYGLYLISSRTQDQIAGCVANTFAQVTSTPPQVSIALNKENNTTALIKESGRYVAVCLSEQAPIELIQTFGFNHSFDTNKFEQFDTSQDTNGIPYVTQETVAQFSVKVSGCLDLGTHVLFVGTVEDAQVLAQGTPMTYAYYHQVKGGKTPPRAPGYIAEMEASAANSSSADNNDITSENENTAPPAYAWKCSVCGHIEYADELAPDFVCPICGADRSKFVRIEL